jgi:large subunit ribosomal protein L19
MSYDLLNIEKKLIFSTQIKNNFNVGDIISVHTKINDGKKERIQIFTGICIVKKGKSICQTFIVRKYQFKEYVERIFPLFSPIITKIVVQQTHKVRRAKLYYLRKTLGKKIKLKKSTK